jgi:phosphatidylserine/phosphatidylglycerophosphate/cardiolipin synthase-like enzyme
MSGAIALANNDVAFVSWSYDARIPNCLGFSLRRIDATGMPTVLPAWVGFQGDSNPQWLGRTTDDWPVQKFNWRDFSAKPGGTYRYQIVPMIGAPGQLAPATGQTLETNPVTLTPQCGPFLAYFNRGILSTQSVAHLLPEDANGRPSSGALVKHITTPGDPLRMRLAGQMIDALGMLFQQAKAAGGELYCALYELSDAELVAQLLSAGSSVHVVLSNTGPDDATDAPTRKQLHDAGLDVTDRMLGANHIGHNKFVVYVDKEGQPQAVLTGSTNWTSTAICGQSNNALICRDATIAATYLDYWNRLKADGQAQGADFRAANNERRPVPSLDVDVWFSPNTTQKSKGTDTPGDLADVAEEIGKAQEAILFLLFQPGSPSVLDEIVKANQANTNLFVRGAATDPKAVDQFNTALYHRSATQSPDVVNDTAMVAASAVPDTFAYWHKELLKSSPSAHAIIHDKIIVIDPFSDKAVVITGSHNLGFKASYANDENMVIVRGRQDLAAAYTTHVTDVYDHYRWRYWLQQAGTKAWTGLVTTDAWQDPYLAAGSTSAREIAFWQSARLPAGVR